MFEECGMKLIFWLIIAHYVSDFALQSNWIAQNKGKLWYVLMSHCIIWTGICCIPLELFGSFAWWKPVFLFIGHFLSDRWKARQPNDDAHWHLIYYDQAIHGLQLLIVGVF
jgi:hypothetical protein